MFDSANNPQTSNSARGDVNSVNLRSLGVGNTLVLLNGRRLVQHPTSQGASGTGTVTVLSYNSIATPVSGLERLEVLLDGAAVIYARDGGVILTSGVLAGGTEANRFRADLRAVYQYYCLNHPGPDEAQYPVRQGLPEGVRLTRTQRPQSAGMCRGFRGLDGLDRPRG